MAGGWSNWIVIVKAIEFQLPVAMAEQTAEDTVNGIDVTLRTEGPEAQDGHDLGSDVLHQALVDAIDEAAAEITGTTFEPEVIAECAECGIDIYHGEWHVQTESESDRVPDNVISSVERGHPDGDRVCIPCSDRDVDECPGDNPIAGVDRDD